MGNCMHLNLILGSHIEGHSHSLPGRNDKHNAHRCPFDVSFEPGLVCVGQRDVREGRFGNGKHISSTIEEPFDFSCILRDWSVNEPTRSVE